MSRALPSLSRVEYRSESGQAMVLGLMLVSLGGLGWALSYYIGNIVHDKVSLVRATDASVLSVATLQARTLNLHAYLNRAQLAHQLAMIHLVTLASHERFRATQAKQSLRMNPPAFLIGMFFGPTYAASYMASQSGLADDYLAIQNLATVFKKHDQVIREVLEQARQNISSEINSIRIQTLEKILINNVGRSGSSLRGQSLAQLGLSYAIERDDFRDGIKSFSTQSPVWDNIFKQVIDPYGYLKPRHATRENIWAVNIRCPHKRHELRRRGHTHAHANGTYQSDDTISFHAVRSNRIIGCYQREYPMGWAEISTSAQKSSLLADKLDNTTDKSTDATNQSFSKQSFWRWVKSQGIPGWDIINGSANSLAASWSAGKKISWQSSPHLRFMDIDSTPSGFRFDIKTAKSVAILNQSKNKSSFTGRFNFLRDDSTDILTAHSSSSTYFSRPSARKDGRQERPNLFHPYWHARLVNQ